MRQNDKLLRVQRMVQPVTPESPISVLRRHYSLPQKQYTCDMHFALELGVVLNGRMERQCPGWEKILEPGQMWLCGVWEPHGYRTKSAPCDVIVFFIWPVALMEMSYSEAPRFNWVAPFVAPAGNRPDISIALRPSAIALGKRAANLATETPASPSDEHARLKLRLCLMEALLALTEEWRPPPGRKPHFIPFYSRLNRIIEQIFNQRRFISVDEAARLCNMSHYAFCKAFREMMGIKFNDFMLRCRLNGARNQLLSAKSSIKEIAHNWGFVDHSHFYRAFIRHYGCKPSDYLARRKPEWR